MKTENQKQDTEEVYLNQLIDEANKEFSLDRKLAKKVALKFAKWQTEKMYSEKEVLNILNEFCDNFYENSIREDIIIKWFEQFKKKA